MGFKNHISGNGFTLVELLVSVFIFSIGLLGVATMHSLSLKESIDHSQRSHAVMMMQELTARMRSNIAGTYGGDYTNAAMSQNCAAPAAMCSDYPGDNGVSCSAAQLAVYDIWELTCGRRAGTVSVGSSSQLLFRALTIGCAGEGGKCPAGSVHTMTLTWDSKASEVVNNTGMRVQQLSQAVVM